MSRRRCYNIHEHLTIWILRFLSLSQCQTATVSHVWNVSRGMVASEQTDGVEACSVCQNEGLVMLTFSHNNERKETDGWQSLMKTGSVTNGISLVHNRLICAAVLVCKIQILNAVHIHVYLVTKNTELSAVAEVNENSFKMYMTQMMQLQGGCQQSHIWISQDIP